MTRQVLVSPQAEAQIQVIDAWWRENRPSSPDLFLQELSEAIALLQVSAEAGKHYAHRSIKGVRRIPLRATRHHVYYVASRDAVAVLAVWGAVKGVGPHLSKLDG